MYLLEVLVTNGRDVNLNEIIDDVATTDRRERKEEVTSRVWEKKKRKKEREPEKTNQPVGGRREKWKRSYEACSLQYSKILYIVDFTEGAYADRDSR